jgi:sugar phosphate isomerase/epimerase
VEAVGATAAGQHIRTLGLTVPGYCRSAYLAVADEAQRKANIASNIRALGEAVEIGAECFVLVVGGAAGIYDGLAGAYSQVQDGIGELYVEAQKLGVPLAIEPLHPMYAADRSVINTIRQALALCESIAPYDNTMLGLAIDVYHCWWDPELASSIALAGQAGRIRAYHVCDWLPETRHMLTDRGMMGDGVIDLRGFRKLIEQAGYTGMMEVEIFSAERWWKVPQDEVLSICAQRLLSVC